MALFYLLILLLPSQLGRHWWPEWSLVNGIRIDYLSPTLYATDLLLIAMFILMIWERRREKKAKSGKKEKKTEKAAGILILGIIWILKAERPALALYWLARYLEIPLMAGIVSKIQNTKYRIQNFLTIGVVFLVALAIAQIFLGRTSGLFWLLGERNFNISTAGIATIAIQGKEILRPYATFGHPNALAGYLAVAGMIVGLSTGGGIIRKISFLGVLLTASRAAIIAMLGTWGFMGIQGIKGIERAGGWILFAPRAAEERLILNKAGWEIFRDNWLWGIGPGQFLVHLPDYMPTGERNLQPAHNIFLLLFTEFGMIGGGIIVISIIKVIKIVRRNPENKYWVEILAIIGITALFDHYWVTSQQNRLLLGLVIGLINCTNYTNCAKQKKGKKEKLN